MANLPRGDPINAVSGTLTTAVAYLDVEMQQANYLANSPNSSSHTGDARKPDLYPKQQYNLFLESDLNLQAHPMQQQTDHNGANEFVAGGSGLMPGKLPPVKRHKHKKSKKKSKKRSKSPKRHKHGDKKKKEEDIDPNPSMPGIQRSQSLDEGADSNIPPPPGFDGDAGGDAVIPLHRSQSLTACEADAETGTRSTVPLEPMYGSQHDKPPNLPPLRRKKMPSEPMDLLEDAT